MLEDLAFWNERAENDRNFSSVISPDDRLGLKAEYVDTVNKRCIEKELSTLVAGSKILDFGCGVGRISRWDLFKKHRYFGIDPSDKMIAAAKNYFGHNPDLTFAAHQGPQLPFASDSFDCIIAIWVLQHILEEDRLRNFLDEFSRVLKGGGKLLLFEQISETESLECLKNGSAYKKHRTASRYADLFGEQFSFVPPRKTEGLVSHGPFYKSLMLFNVLHLPFIKNFIGTFILLDGYFYRLLRPLRIFKPRWVDTFISITKKN